MNILLLEKERNNIQHIVYTFYTKSDNYLPSKIISDDTNLAVLSFRNLLLLWVKKSNYETYFAISFLTHIITLHCFSEVCQYASFRSLVTNKVPELTLLLQKHQHDILFQVQKKAVFSSQVLSWLLLLFSWQLPLHLDKNS